MCVQKRDVSNIYGLRDTHGITSWRGLAAYLARSLKAGRCPRLEECSYEHRYTRCLKVVKRSEVQHALEARFMLDESLAEKMIDTLLTKALAHTHRCGGGVQMLSFEA